MVGAQLTVVPLRASPEENDVAIQSMAERYTRPDWVRRLNAMGESVGGRVEGARKLVPIDPAALLEQAVREVGEPKSDFGDPGWRGRFETLARALDASPLHLVGRLLTKQELLRSLRARLLLGHARRPRSPRSSASASRRPSS